jgi:hypothetical protein
MVSLKFKLKGEEFTVYADATIDPREAILGLEKKILSKAQEKAVSLPEKTKKYLASMIAKTLIVQYPARGENEPLELEPQEIGE